MYLLPKPKKYEKKQGFYEISWNTVLTIDENMPLDGTVYAGILQSCIQKHAGIACAFLKGTQRTGDIFLTMEPQLYAVAKSVPKGCRKKDYSNRSSFLRQPVSL